MLTRRSSSGRTPWLAMFAAVVGLALGAAGFLAARAATFSDQASVTDNSFATDTLDPPTGLMASASGSDIVLNWTATVDTYASGYKVYRGTTSGGPYFEIATVTPATVTTYTDSPPPGTYFYVLRTYHQNWASVDSNEASATVGGFGCNTYASTDVPKAIPDLSTITSTLTVSDSFTLTDVNVGPLSITHTWDADLDVFLISPAGTWVELFTDVGGSGDNFTNTVLDDEAATAIACGSAPFGGSYRPEGLLSGLDGQTSAGTWTLRITDDAPADIGTLNSWQLQLCYGPPPPPPCNAYTSPDVPKAIPDLTTITSTLSVSDSFTLADVNVGPLSVTHTWDADLDVFIISPAGTQVELFTDVGGSGDNFSDTVLDDEAATAITSGLAPFAGCYRPEGLLSGLDGQTSAGTWTLRITDDAAGDTGTLNSWSLELCN